MGLRIQSNHRCLLPDYDEPLLHGKRNDTAVICIVIKTPTIIIGSLFFLTGPLFFFFFFFFFDVVDNFYIVKHFFDEFMFFHQGLGLQLDFKRTSHELQVASYELLFIARVTSCILDTNCKLPIIARVTSYFLHASYELLFIASVTSYFLQASYGLLLIAQNTSSFLRVTRQTNET